MNSAADTLDPRSRPWAVRMHAALMPDYNRKATVYWWSVVLCGALALASAAGMLLAMPARELMQVGALVAIALLTSLVPVRVPGLKNSFAAGEIFFFLLLLMHGPAAATLAAAGEGLIGSLRTSRRWTSRIATPAMASLAMFAAGSTLQAGLAAAAARGLGGATVLLGAMMLFALLYFMLNTLLIAAMPYLKRSQWPAPAELLRNFGWIGVTYTGSASLACLLFLGYQQSGVAVLLAAAPIIAMLLSTLHFYGRQQESVARETALAARHLQELAVSERQFHSAFTHASIGMALVDFDARVLQANAALGALLGLRAAEVVQRPFDEFVDPAAVATLLESLTALNAQRIASFAVELPLQHSDGSEAWAAVHGSFFSELDSATPCVILQVQNITARRRAEAGLQHIAFHDSLTALPNRRRFNEQLEHALARLGTEPQRHFGLMFLDFDRFKLINDSLGHAVGDEFLIQVSRRIREHVRPGDIVARLGGDEFAVLAEDLGGECVAVQLAERLLDVLRQPFQIGGTEITTSASIGITFSNMGYTTPAEMLRDADTAMYKAKAGGKARYALFDSGLHEEVSGRLKLEGDLRRALAAGTMSVAYQPLFELATGRVTGFEALARWDHPELGAVSPASFIDVAEDAGLIIPLTTFMLRSACAQLRQWQLSDARFAELGMHVNVSGNDIAHPGFVARVTAALVEARLEPQYLTLELTENILMERLEAALPALTELRRLGIGLSVDDFGAGYSSLKHLSSLPVNSLKIDRSFVADLQRGPEGAAVIRAIVMLGKSLGKAVIAEGVETAAQLEQLSRIGCVTGQGFYLSHPLSAARIDQMLGALVAPACGALPASPLAAQAALRVH